MEVINSALVDRSVAGAKVLDRFQFERMGYFSLDPDSTSDKVLWEFLFDIQRLPIQVLHFCCSGV